MHLPDYVAVCVRSLEKAGFSAYAVGGCVRDALLGLTPHDYDLCTAATPEQIKAVFAGCNLVLAGEKHGTVGVVLEGNVVEITTFRTEGEYADHRHPNRIAFVESVEADLARRDFTMNAMAFSPERGIVDPFGGAEDLRCHRLQAVGDPQIRFQEDALRILRGVRFAARFDLTPEPATMDAMQRLSPLMDTLAKERIFDELCKLLPVINAQQLLQFAPILSRAIPELAPCLNFDQHSKHHAYDLYTHIAHVVAAVPPQLPLRWAALLHDVGKIQTFSADEFGEGHFYGHAQASAQMADEILRRLKAPTALRQQVVDLIRQHMTRICPEKKAVRRWLGRLGPEGLEQLLCLQEADMGSKGTGKPAEMEQFGQIRQLAALLLEENACMTLKDLAINGRDVTALGFSGPVVGEILSGLLELVVEEVLPNERQALLAAVPGFLSEAARKFNRPS